MSEINLGQVESLGKLSLTGDEARVVPEQISSIVAYVDQLQGVDVKVEHRHRQVLTSADLRPDEVRAFEDRALLFENMPARFGDFLEVPEVFAE